MLVRTVVKVVTCDCAVLAAGALEDDPPLVSATELADGEDVDPVPEEGFGDEEAAATEELLCTGDAVEEAESWE